ncbi:MAG: hypothetical protein JST27_00590, partial [Bacteroidetes bacterium]|nr:hypothetical protein [Bacteroidota bacterium]
MKTIYLTIGTMLLAGALQAQTWDGSTDDDWGTASNWSTNSVPTSSSNVTIPGSLTNYPKLGANVTIAALTMQNGSSMNLNGKTFTMTGNLSILSATVSGGGSFNSSGAGNVDMESSTLTTTLSITGYTGTAHIYDNSITGNTVISNTSGQGGDNYIDGNTITGTLSLTGASNNNEMDEGYGSPTSTKNHITGDASFSCTGTKNLFTSYSRATQFDADLSISHSGSGGVIAFNSGGSVGGDFSLSSLSGSGSNAINSGAVSVVSVAGTVNVTVANGQNFDMRSIKNNTSGGSLSVTGPASVEFRTDTLKCNVSITGYTGTAHIFDNSITGNTVISNASGQSGDNFIDGNSITGTLSLTGASNNYEMDEGYGSPTSHNNHITGNASFSCTGAKNFFTSYSRPTQFDADLSISHSGSGGVIAFNSGGSVGGNFSLNSPSGSGYNNINSGAATVVPVTGTVTITVANGQDFNMQRVKNNTLGGSVSVTSPSSVYFISDTLKSNVSFANYTGAGYFFDNKITGNAVISNTSSQSGDNFIDGNNITGTLSLTQASNNYDMSEGHNSPSSNADVIGGNTTFYLSGSKTLNSSNDRPTQFGSNLTISHTGSGNLSIFNSSASIGGNFSLTSSAGSDYLNSGYSSKVPIGGTVNITVTSHGEFNMQRLANNTLGGTVSIDSPSNVTLRSDTLSSNTSITGYYATGHFWDNSITGNLSISNKYSQSGDNY